MRAIFLQYSQNLKPGTYIFVAKYLININEFKFVEKDFYNNLRRCNVFKD